MRKLTMQEFMKEFRPNGFGKIEIHDGKTGKIEKKIKVYEVVCDICNESIADGETVNMCFDDSYAVCDTCAKKINENEK